MTTCGKIVIGGGTGFIGSYLVNLLRLKKYEVVIVSRKPGLQTISWNDVVKNGLPDQTSAVVNLAGQNVLDPTRRWTTGFKQNVWTSRVNTTQTLSQAIQNTSVKPQVFVTISGVGVYPASPSAEYTEESPVSEFDFLSKLCHAWEEAAQISSQQVRTVTIRSGVVLGRNGGMIKQLWLPFFLGVGGPVGTGEQYLPWIHIEDLTQFILYAIENKNVKGVYNGVAPQVITNKQFSNTLAKAMWRPAFFPVPTAVLNVAFSEERAKIMTEGQKVIPKRTLETGFQYKYPKVEDACSQVVLAKP